MPAGERDARYFDTSVLVKGYVTERGSETAIRALQEHTVVSSMLAPVELTGALRRYREVATSSEVAAAESRFARERAEWWLIAIDVDVLRRAERVIATTAIRTLDAVHLGAALAFREQVQGDVPFMTADERQRRAAVALGLRVIFLA